jgi:hypothetical protein
VTARVNDIVSFRAFCRHSITAHSFTQRPPRHKPRSKCDSKGWASFAEEMCNWQQFQTSNAAASRDRLGISLAEQVKFWASEQILTQPPLGSDSRCALPSRASGTQRRGCGEALSAFDVHPGNARGVRVTINERMLADSFWPALNGPERVNVKRDLLAKIFANRQPYCNEFIWW